MQNQEQDCPTEQDLSDGELVDQGPLEDVEDPPVRLAGYNQIPDFGEDTAGTLQDESDEESSNE
jgi:hypothetical protein